MHYPFNFLFLTSWFQKVQLPIYIFAGVFFIAVAIVMIEMINNNRTVNLKTIYKRVSSSYIHLFMAGAVSAGALMGASSLFGLVVQRAMMIRSTTGKFFILKKAILTSVPFVNFLLWILVTAVLIYLIPLIVIERKKIIAALIANFKFLVKSFAVTLAIVFLPSLLYIPILLLKFNGKLFETILVPELWIVLLVLGVIVELVIDAIIYTAATTNYLLTKGS